ncbi:MAG: Trk system potassium transporter TrkA [Erysipelotrichaceae bacterium]|nr:Trk system potassium transporter TrkA [Erysipelotrichaceae bacterium]
MKILVVGCGKVGRTTAEELAKENHDVVLIDKNPGLVEEVSNSIDVLGVAGEGSSIKILKEAGVEKCDLVIAVTNADETNMLTCLFAKKLNKNCKTIARVRNPHYIEDINYVQNELGIDVTINPEMITARQISRLIRWPNALNVDSFVNGKIETISFAVGDNHNLVGKSLIEIKKIYRDDVLFVGIERGSEAIIPNGDTVIAENDKVTICATPKNATIFLNKLGIYQMPIKNCMIVGGSKIAYYLATILQNMNIDICILDKDRNKCEELASLLPKASIVHGYASDDNILIEEGLPDADCFVSLTGIDEENVLLSLYAKTISQAKIITKVNHISYKGVLNNLDVGALVSPKLITADDIISYVRGMSNATANDVEAMHHFLDNKAEALTFVINKKTNVVGVPFEKLKLKKNLLICYIVRQGAIIIPNGSTCMEVGDTVLLVTTNSGLKSIEDIVD